MSENNSTIVLTADDATAAPLVAVIKSTVNGAAKYAAYVTAHGVTRDNVKFHAAALAVLAYPNDKPVQKSDGTRTRFGNAVQAAGAGLRRALPAAPAKTDVTLRVSLSGEGGGSTVVPTDHPLYEDIVALLAGE